MAKILWPLEPHTRGKHLVLRRYLHAWLPIMGRRPGRILFIDGFAGPGEYEGGEVGSPIIALDALIEHNAKAAITAEVLFFFVEKEPDRARHLTELVRTRLPKLPKGCQAEVKCGTFDEALTQGLDLLDEKNQTMAPPFVMVDPFGVSGTPMRLIERILRHPRSEVYVSFMYEYMNRFKTTNEFAPHLDELFGTRTWRDGVGIGEPTERKDFFYGLYEQQLRNAGAEYVVRFELWDEDRLVYAIFFATKHVTGCDRMKQAIWSVDPMGQFHYRGTRSKQLELDIHRPDFRQLRQAIESEYRGKGWVTIEQLRQFTASDRTDYHSLQLKKNVLVPMETEGAIEVDPTSRRRKRTYPEGTRLRIL